MPVKTRSKRPLILVLLGIAAAGCDGKAAGKAALPPAAGQAAVPLPVLPKIEAESDRAIATQGRTTGTTFAHQQAQLGPNMSGTIAKINVREADPIKRGEVLFRLDARQAELAIAQAKAGLAQAEVNLKATKVEHERSKGLVQKDAIGRAQWDQMEARLEAAEVGVEQAKVGLEMAKKMYEDTMVRAPFDGVVVAKLKSEGETATMMPPTVVLVVQDQTLLDLRFHVSERALPYIKAGDAVEVRFSALGDEKREAKISRIVPAIDARTRTMEVIAEIPNPDGVLKPGLLAEVTVTANRTPPGAAAAGSAR
jgi:RND family efflux transporter MFP subunit